SGLGDQSDIAAAQQGLQPGFDLLGVDFTRQRVDGDVLQRPCRADELQEGPCGLCVFGNIGVQSRSQLVCCLRQPGTRGGLAQGNGNQMQGAGGFQVCSKGFSPN